MISRAEESLIVLSEIKRREISGRHGRRPRPRNEREANSAGMSGCGQAQHLKQLRAAAPARRPFFLLLFLWTRKEKVEHNRKEKVG